MSYEHLIPKPVKPGWFTEEQAQSEKDVLEAELLIERMGLIGIPKRFHSKTIESYVPACDASRKAHKWVADYAKDLHGHLSQTEPLPEAHAGRSALFLGAPGTGKTHLAIGVIKAITSVGTARFLTVQGAIRSIKDSWAKDSDVSESKAIARLTGPDLLVLDEVGVQFGSTFETNALFDVLNSRYLDEKPTILLSNLDFDEVKKYLGERVLDRMREDGGTVMLFDWASHRGAQL